MSELVFGNFQGPLSALGVHLGLSSFPPPDLAEQPLSGRELNKALSRLADRPTDDIWAQLYSDFQTHHVRALPTSVGGPAVELFARFGVSPDPLGWVPLHVIGFGLVMGHFLPNYPKPKIPDCFVCFVLLEVEDYVLLQSRFVGINLVNMQQSFPALLPEELQVLHETGPREVVPFLPVLFPQSARVTRVLQEMALKQGDIDWDWVAQRLEGSEALWCRSLRHRPNTELFELIKVSGTPLGVADPSALRFSQDEFHFGPLQISEKSWAVQCKVIPIFVRGEIVVLGSPLAGSEDVRNTVLSTLVGSRVFFCLISEESFTAMAPCWYKQEAADDSVAEGEPILPYDGKVAISVSETRAAADSNWTKTFVSQFVAQAVDRGASDIHIEPMGDHFRIRFRIDGVLVEPYDRFPAAFCSFVVRRVKTLAGMDISNTREGLDGRLKQLFRGRDVDFRVATMPVSSNKGTDNETCVIRILDVQSAPKRLEEVCYSDTQCATLRRASANSTGLVLMTGPTGSGKSTTLYAMLGELNSPTKKVITIEDPVERRVLGVNQTQVIAPNTFAKSLRSALRADPDIILVGEIRDDETAELSLKASLTGHLVFSTLHANSAAATLDRMSSLGVKPADVAACLLLVTAQRLVRKVCLGCRSRKKASPDILEDFSTRGITSSLLDEGYVYESLGCPYCFGSGYKGRIAVLELLEMSAGISKVLNGKQGFTPEQLQEAAIAAGFTNLYHNGLVAVANGITDLREVRSDLADRYF